MMVGMVNFLQFIPIKRERTGINIIQRACELGILTMIKYTIIIDVMTITSPILPKNIVKQEGITLMFETAC